MMPSINLLSSSVVSPDSYRETCTPRTIFNNAAQKNFFLPFRDGAKYFPSSTPSQQNLLLLLLMPYM